MERDVPNNVSDFNLKMDSGLIASVDRMVIGGHQIRTNRTEERQKKQHLFHCFLINNYFY